MSSWPQYTSLRGIDLSVSFAVNSSRCSFSPPFFWGYPLCLCRYSPSPDRSVFPSWLQKSGLCRPVTRISWQLLKHIHRTFLLLFSSLPLAPLIFITLQKEPTSARVEKISFFGSFRFPNLFNLAFYNPLYADELGEVLVASEP